jgi:hypothetical protein
MPQERHSGQNFSEVELKVVIFPVLTDVSSSSLRKKTIKKHF